MTERELILSLCAEAGDDVSDPDEVEAGFRFNHNPADIRDAAAGNVEAIFRLRYDCGLPIVR